MNGFEEKIQRLGMLMKSDPLSPEVQLLAKEIKAQCSTPLEQQTLDDFVAKGIADLSADIDHLHKEAVSLQLAEVSDMINLSYIAKRYFNKSRAWLSQRINGNTVNGKQCRFTDSELAIFNHALQDMSLQLAAVRVSAVSPA